MLVFPLGTKGITEASMTRRLVVPNTLYKSNYNEIILQYNLKHIYANTDLSDESTTATVALGPIRHELVG